MGSLRQCLPGGGGQALDGEAEVLAQGRTLVALVYYAAPAEVGEEAVDDEVVLLVARYASQGDYVQDAGVEAFLDRVGNLLGRA